MPPIREECALVAQFTHLKAIKNETRNRVCLHFRASHRAEDDGSCARHITCRVLQLLPEEHILARVAWLNCFFSLPLQDHFQELSVDSLNEDSPRLVQAEVRSAKSGRQCEARAGTLDPEAEVRWFFFVSHIGGENVKVTILLEVCRAAQYKKHGLC